jgi:hypothetical protein
MNQQRTLRRIAHRGDMLVVGFGGRVAFPDLEIASIFMREILRRAAAWLVVSTSNGQYGQLCCAFLPTMSSCDGACAASGTRARRARMARSCSVDKKVVGYIWVRRILEGWIGASQGKEVYLNGSNGSSDFGPDRDERGMGAEVH